MASRRLLLALAGLLLCLIGPVAQPAAAGTAQPRLDQQRFEQIDPVFDGLIPISRKNQAPAIVRRSLSGLVRRCAGLDRSDPLQRALRGDCLAIVRLTRRMLPVARCRGLKGCARIMRRLGQELERSRNIARRANATYRRQLRGRCLKSFTTPKSDLHLFSRLRFRALRLARAMAHRDDLAIFVESLIWDQLLTNIDDEGPTARENWREFRRNCRPKPVTTVEA